MTAEEIREQLSIEDKTNLVAKAIIELVKERKNIISFKEISNKIQDYFSLPHFKPYIVYFQGNHISSVGYYIEKLYRDCFEKYNKIPINFAVLNSKYKHYSKERFEYLDKLTKIKNKRNNDTENYYRQVVIDAICNGDYDFLLKPIPILEKIKVEKSIDEETKDIKDKNERDNSREIRKEQTIYLREHFKEEEKDKIKNRARNKCEYCSCETFEKQDGEMYFEIHHIVHYSDGGKNTAENCVLLCPNCHRKIHFAREEIIKEMEEKLKDKISKTN